MRTPINLSSVSKTRLAEFLNSFDTVLYDFDGVLNNGYTLIPGISDSVIYLSKLGKVSKILSNNSTYSEEIWNNKLKDIHLNYNDVFVPVKAITKYLKSVNFDKELFVFALEHEINYLKKQGIKVYELENHPHIKVIPEIFSYIQDDEKIGAVLLDIDCNSSVARYSKAVQCLKRKDVLLLSGATDLCATLANVTILGPYFSQQSVELISGRSALVFGKPGKLMGDYINEEMKLNPERTLFVGDALETDMIFASKCGFKKLLVYTGTAKPEDIIDCEEEMVPDYVLNSFADLYKLIK